MDSCTLHDIIELQARVAVIRCYVQIILDQAEGSESCFLPTEEYLCKILNHLRGLDEIVNNRFVALLNNPGEHFCIVKSHQ